MKYELNDYIRNWAANHMDCLPLLDTLRGRGSVWHCTTHARFKKIVEAGQLVPSGTAGVKCTYTGSLAKLMGYIALFDFDTLPVEFALVKSLDWVPFYKSPSNWPTEGRTIAIEIDRKALAHDLYLDPHKIGEEFERTLGTNPVKHIPYVEAGYRGPIPSTAFKTFRVVAGNLGEESTDFPAAHASLAEIESQILKSNAKDEQRHAEHIAGGGVDVSMLLEQAQRRQRPEKNGDST